MIFCASSIPNHTMVRGTSAEIGRKRRGSSTEAKKCLTAGKVPIQIPSGMATSGREQEAHGHAVEAPARAADERLLEVQPGKARRTSVGEGRITAGTKPP